MTQGAVPKSTLAPHDREAPLVKRIFDIAFQGKGGKEIAKELNASGLKTRTGQLFSATGINRILRNEAYIGTLVWNRHSRKVGTRRAIPESDVVRVPECHQALVPEDVFWRVQDMLSSLRPTSVHPRSVSSQYLLSGIVYCGVCGSTAIGTNGKSGQFLYYSCNSRFKKGDRVCPAPSLNANRLEGFVLDRIKANILAEDNLKELLNLTNEELSASRRRAQEDLDTIDQSMQDVDRKLGRLYSALEGGKVDVDDLAPRLKEVRSDQKTLLDKQAGALAQLNEAGPPDIDPPKLRRLVTDLRSILGSGTFLESKTFLQSFIRKVEYTKTEVAIEYAVPVNLAGELTGTKEVLNTRTVGSRGRIRTCDLAVNSRPLYR